MCEAVAPLPVHLKRVPVLIRPEYVILYERVPGHTFIHCDVHVRWTKGVKNRLTEDFKKLCSLISPEPLWALHDEGDTKHEKFLAMFGFHFVRKYGEAQAIYKKET